MSLHVPDGMIFRSSDTGRPDSEDTAVLGPTNLSHLPGDGSFENPFIVDWELGELENPYNWTKRRKWIITAQVRTQSTLGCGCRSYLGRFKLALSIFTASFSSSSYSGGLTFTERDLHIPEDVAVLGISLYVLGFGLGPLVFAPLSEMYGRVSHISLPTLEEEADDLQRAVFLSTYSIFTFLHIGGALARNTATLLSCRLLSGIFGSSPLTNAGGALSDIWNARERGLAAALYAMAPYLGVSHILY